LGAIKKSLFLLFALLGVLKPGAAENNGEGYPSIIRLDTRDTLFRQYLADVETARGRLFNSRQTGGSPAFIAEALTIYAYVPQEGDDALGLAARCNIPYAALVTLNRLSHSSGLGSAGTLLLPSTPGIFIPEDPQSGLERLLSSGRLQEEGIVLTINRRGQKEKFRFIPGADFTPTERIFFLNREFRFPLRNFRLTSAFGLRVNPVTGKLRIHEGIDLAAPEGSEVYAARDGEVIDTGEDTVYGRYIIIRHGENWVSLYGHLSKIETALRQKVRSGSLIGRVGSTGQSTGPHLHFELRQNGRAQDPGRYLRLFQD
jgi:murein DD-endopeptidase MepM/ murein hydrolase activator NlpD